MANSIEKLVIKLTTFEYTVFDQKYSGFEYDANPQQIADLIRKDIHGTADFTKMTEFYLKTGDVVFVNLKTITRSYEEGSSDDPKVITKRKQRDIDTFKDKNKNILTDNDK